MWVCRLYLCAGLSVCVNETVWVLESVCIWMTSWLLALSRVGKAPFSHGAGRGPCTGESGGDEGGEEGQEQRCRRVLAVLQEGSILQRNRRARTEGCVGPRWSQASVLAFAEGNGGTPHLGSPLSWKGGGNLGQFPLQGQPSAGTPRAARGYQCTQAAPSARKVGDSCGIWGKGALWPRGCCPC